MNSKRIYQIDYQTVVDENVCIGRGAYAKVYACERMEQKNLGIACCVKILEEQGRPDSVIKIFSREEKMMNLIRQAKNPNLVVIFDVIRKEEKVYIVMQKCDGGDLRKQMEKRRQAKNWYTCAEAVGIIKQLVNGYKTCQSKDMIHRDLKPENILIHKGIAQIADFGLGRTMDNLGNRENMTMVGTPAYTAPQLFFEDSYSSLADMYSLGVIFHELVYGKHPIEAKSMPTLQKQLREQATKPLRLIVNEICPQEVRDIIEKMLRYHEEDRMSWSNLFDHPLFKCDNQGKVLPKAQVVIPNRKGTIKIINNQNSQQDMNKNQKYNIDHQTVVYQTVRIGKGAYGDVYACERKEQKTSGIACCVKILQKQGCPDSELKLIKREVDMSKLIREANNPNLVVILDVIENEETVYIVMQRCDGDLRQQMRQKREEKKWYTYAEAIGIMKQLINGYKTCQSKDMIHRDLKPENILMHKGIAQIADFGHGRTVDNLAKRENMTLQMGTKLYIAPQLFFEEPYSSLADMYSLGVIFHELIYDKPPIENTALPILFEKLRELATKPIKLTVNNSCPPEVRDIIERMLRYHEQDRMSWSSLFDHPLFKYDNQGKVLPQTQVVIPKRKAIIKVTKDSQFEPIRYIDLEFQQNQQDKSQKEIQTIIIQKQQLANNQNSPIKKNLSIRIISISQYDL